VIDLAIIYSTGPVERDGSNTEVVLAKVLNNSQTETATVRIRAWALNGSKDRIFDDTLTINPRSSDFVTIDVFDTAEFEVQFRIELNSASNDEIERFVLPSVWGKDGNGEIVPEHRILTAELKLTRPIKD
jgi:hypothetical protein